MYAIRVHATGGPEVLSYEEVPLPEPGPGEARVRVAAAGLNYIDTYHRTGLYPLPLPFTPGMEMAGVVDAVGPEVHDVAVGDHVACGFQLGSYADYLTVPAAKLVHVPAQIDLQVAAAVMLQGMTAHYLTTSTVALQPGQTVLVHAAAGGAGLLLVQMAKQRGARVFGTVSTEEKAALAREAGAEAAILYTQEDFVAAVRRLTEDAGVDVVYDSVGQATFAGSLSLLRRRGTLVLFGQSSGPVEPISPSALARGSLALTRPGLGDYVATREELTWRAGDVFAAMLQGTLTVRIDRVFPLAEAAAAHAALEGRATMGKVLLAPGA